jgi:hypothetical protein
LNAAAVRGFAEFDPLNMKLVQYALFPPPCHVVIPCCAAIDVEYLSVASGLVGAAASGQEEEQYLGVSQQNESDDGEAFEC